MIGLNQEDFDLVVTTSLETDHKLVQNRDSDGSASLEMYLFIHCFAIDSNCILYGAF